MLTQLTVGNIKIRPYQPDDVAAFYAAVRISVATVGQWLPWCHAQFSLLDAKAWIAACQQCWRDVREFHFVITIEANAIPPQIIGGIGIRTSGGI